MATSFELVLPVKSDEYRFKICTRILDMGPAGDVRYLWLDLRDFRAGGRNFRHCVDYWWRTASALAPPDDLIHNELNLVLAELFPLFAKSTGCHDIFRDALLGKKWADGYSLPDEDWQRILGKAKSQDLAGMRDELQEGLVGTLPPRILAPRRRRAIRRWMMPAIQALRAGGRLALRQFLTQEIPPRILKYRRRGDQRQVHTFLNALGHETKVAAHRCYAAVWREFLSRLHQFGKLDDRSMRFNWLWHSQQHNDACRDVFFGAVLALHPLSGRVMGEPSYLSAVGGWLEASEKTCADPRTNDYKCNEYWLMLAALAAAGQEYAQIRERSNARRAQARCA